MGKPVPCVGHLDVAFLISGEDDHPCFPGEWHRKESHESRPQPPTVTLLSPDCAAAACPGQNGRSEHPAPASTWAGLHLPKREAYLRLGKPVSNPALSQSSPRRVKAGDADHKGAPFVREAGGWTRHRVATGASRKAVGFPRVVESQDQTVGPSQTKTLSSQLCSLKPHLLPEV